MEAKQVGFIPEDEELHYGIMVNNEFIICGCCGGVFEINEVELVEVFETWVDISDEICGD